MINDVFDMRDKKRVPNNWFAWRIEKDVTDHNTENGIFPWDKEYDFLERDIHAKVYARCKSLPENTGVVEIRGKGEYVIADWSAADSQELVLEMWSNPKKGISFVKRYDPSTGNLAFVEKVTKDYLFVQKYKEGHSKIIESACVVFLSSGKFIHNTYAPRMTTQRGVLANISGKFVGADGTRRRPEYWSVVHEFIYQSRAARL